MATPLDPATQAAVGAFAGLVEVTVQQVRMPHTCPNRRFLGTRRRPNPPDANPTLPPSPPAPLPASPSPFTR